MGAGPRRIGESGGGFPYFRPGAVEGLDPNPYRRPRLVALISLPKLGGELLERHSKNNMGSGAL